MAKMSQISGDPPQPRRSGETSVRAAMIMMGVISLMSAALAVDANNTTIETMALGTLAVGGLVTIGSMIVEVMRKLIEGSDRPNVKAITISHAFILAYPLICLLVLLGGSLIGFSSTKLFTLLFFSGGGVAFLSGALSRYALDRKQRSAIFRGCLWLGVSMILILAKTLR